MRILIINSEYPPLGGGAGNASANLARTLRTKDQQVAVMTVKFPGLARVETQDGILVSRIPALRKHQDRSDPFEQLSFIVSGATHILPFVRSWKPGVIVAFFGVPSGAVAWFANLFSGVPYIVSLRGGDVPGFRPYDFDTYHRMIGPFLRRIWKRAGAVVANSKGLRVLGQVFEPNIPIEVISNGVDVDRFKPVERVWNSSRMLFVGRIVYQKGLDILFQALGGLLDLDWTLTLVGDGNQRPHLENQARNLGMLDRIHCTGWLVGDAVVQQYQQATMYVAPSRHEGMSNVVLEAMASGLPIVASNISGNDELVKPGINGLLVPAGDVQSLQSSLRKILTSPEKQEEMGIASRQHVVQSFTWSSMADQYLTLIQDILEQA